MVRNSARLSRSDAATAADGKRVVITGATPGIGYLTARKYASMGADLDLRQQELAKSEALEKEYRQGFRGRCETIQVVI
ncbi:MAG: hypothetical protein MZW92_04295 [Comamonadaceae bacterium]|nr:hypothetical protein [Comamonadaceae bacterium]